MTEIHRTQNIAYCLSPDGSVLLWHSADNTEDSELLAATEMVCSWIRQRLCRRFFIETDGGMPPVKFPTIRSLGKISSAIHDSKYSKPPKVGLITPENSMVFDNLISLVRAAVRKIDLVYDPQNPTSTVHSAVGLTEGDLALLEELKR